MRALSVSSRWIPRCSLSLGLLLLVSACDDGAATATADMMGDALSDAALPDAAVGIQGPATGQWRLGMEFVDVGGVTLAFQAELLDSVPGEIGQFVLRVVANDGGLSDPIATVDAVAVDPDGRFVVQLDDTVLPADFSPTNDDLAVTLTLAGETREDFFCGTITGRIETLDLAVSMSTFGATPWPSDETPTSCAWTPGALNKAQIGTDARPAVVHLPLNHDPSMDWPVVMVLHGYSTRGDVQAGYFGLTRRVEEGFLLVVPDGTVDDTDQQYWNALSGCCGGGDPDGPDDVTYLRGLLDEVVADLGGDARRLYVFGHSNGGFMVHRMLCDAGDLVAGGVSLAGGTYADFNDCADNGPVALLNTHGTADDTIPFDGRDGVRAFTGARGAADMWAARNACGAPSEPQALDLMDDPAGDETQATTWADCAAGGDVEFWAHEGGVHIPVLAPAYTERALAFLLRQIKPE